MIIDMHTHTFPESIAKKTIEALANKGNIEPYGFGTEKELLEHMKKSGTDISLVLPVATKVEQVKKINSNSRNIDGLIYAAALHPDLSDFKKQLDFIENKGFKCVKLHPEYQSFDILNSKYFPLYEELSASGLYVTFHAGEDIGFKPPYHSSPKKFNKLCENFPNLRVILAHYGSFNLWDEVFTDLENHKNLYLDTAFCYNRITNNQFLKILKKFSSEKILYATDWPWESQINTLNMLESFKLPKSDLDLILGENAKRILQL